jgi:hypothetical protein
MVKMKRLYEWEEFEDNGKITVYVVLNWFYEGDSYLVNSYEDCFLTIEEAVNYANKKASKLALGEAPIHPRTKSNKKIEHKNIYMPGEELPDEEGGWGSPSYIQILKKEF